MFYEILNVMPTIFAGVRHLLIHCAFEYFSQVLFVFYLCSSWLRRYLCAERYARLFVVISNAHGRHLERNEKSLVHARFKRFLLRRNDGVGGQPGACRRLVTTCRIIPITPIIKNTPFNTICQNHPRASIAAPQAQITSGKKYSTITIYVVNMLIKLNKPYKPNNRHLPSGNTTIKASTISTKGTTQANTPAYGLSMALLPIVTLNLSNSNNLLKAAYTNSKKYAQQIISIKRLYQPRLSNFFNFFNISILITFPFKGGVARRKEVQLLNDCSDPAKSPSWRSPSVFSIFREKLELCRLREEWLFCKPNRTIISNSLSS